VRPVMPEALISRLTAPGSCAAGQQQSGKQDDQSAGDNQGQGESEEWRDVHHFRYDTRAPIAWRPNPLPFRASPLVRLGS
jgi:hypothetical protein